MPLDRPFLTYDQQIFRLQNIYNLNIQNEELALSALSTVSYYDLYNGYKNIFVKDNNFKEYVSFEYLFTFHIYNKNIQHLLFKYSSYAENSYKTNLSYFIAETYSADHRKYLNIKNYKYPKDKKNRIKIKELFYSLINTCYHCTDTPTSHYRKTKNHIPPWILFRNVSFSNSTDLFLFLKRKEKERILESNIILNSSNLSYDKKVEIYLNALTIIRKYRNIIAHNLNFLSYNKCSINKEISKCFHGILVNENDDFGNFNNIWAYILSLILILNNKVLVSTFINELITYLNTIDIFIREYCSITKIPLDYEKRLKEYLKIYNKKCI